VEPVVARPERVADRGGDRTGKRERRASRRRYEVTDRGGTSDAVTAQVRPALKANDRGLRVGSVATVDRPGREAMPGEQELKLRDVEAARAGADRARAKSRPPASPKRGERLRSGDAVDRDAGTSLDRPDRGSRARPREPVDRSALKILRSERHLKSRNRR
jgi:hypothetical protein